MPRRLLSVDVQCADGRPVRIVAGDTAIRVRRVVECWVYQDRWWTAEGPERRVYYRLDTDAGVLDVFRRGSSWTLARELD